MEKKRSGTYSSSKPKASSKKKLSAIEFTDEVVGLVRVQGIRNMRSYN